GNIVLYQRHMLVGRSVIDGIHPPTAHDFLQAFLGAHRAKDGYQPARQRLAAHPRLQLGMDTVEIELAVIEQQQRSRLTADDLPTELSPDRAPRTSHQYRLATNAALEQLHLRRHGIPPEQVGDIHFLNVFDPDLAAGQIHEVRNRTDMQRETLQVLQYLL